MRTCNSCKHWDVFPVDIVKDFKRGTCQRFPPTQDMVAVLERKSLGLDDIIEGATDAMFWRQPTTFEDGICGEHEPAQPAMGTKQVMEWARTYVDGETCISEVPRDKLSPEERAGLEELERLEKILPLHSPTQTPR